MSEVTSKKALKVYQTVILFAIFVFLSSLSVIWYLLFLSTDVGFINKGILEPLWGKSTISWYNESKYWPIILPIVNTWKPFSFRQLFIMPMLFLLISLTMKRLNWMGHQSFKQVRYITLVLLKPVIIMMILLSGRKDFYSDFGLFYQVTQELRSNILTGNTIDTYGVPHIDKARRHWVCLQQQEYISQ